MDGLRKYLKKGLDGFGYGRAHANLKSSRYKERPSSSEKVQRRRNHHPGECLDRSGTRHQTAGPNTIQRIRGLAKVLRSDLEARWGIVLRPEYPVFPWLFE